MFTFLFPAFYSWFSTICGFLSRVYFMLCRIVSALSIMSYYNIITNQTKDYNKTFQTNFKLKIVLFY